MLRRILETQSRKKSFISSVLSSYIFMGILMLGQIVVVPVYIGTFGEYEFGIVAILLSIINFAVVGIAWISGGALRLLGELAGVEDRNRFNEAYGEVRNIYVGYGLILAAVALIVVALLGLRLKADTSAITPHVQYTISLTAIYLVIFFYVAAVRLALIAKEMQGKANWMQVFGQLGYIGATLLLIRYYPFIYIVPISLLIGGVISLLIGLWFLRCREVYGPLGLGNNRAWVRERLLGRTGLGFFIHGFFVLGMLADPAIIGYLSGPKQAAMLYVSWKIGESIVHCNWKLAESLAPYIIRLDSEGRNDRLRIVLLKVERVVRRCATGGAVLYIIAGKRMVQIWVGIENAPQEWYVYWFAGGAIYWLSISRLPIVYASAQIQLQKLIKVQAVDFFGKLFVILALYRPLGFASVLIGINVVRACGVQRMYYSIMRQAMYKN